jgi:divinyl protochlorophyllide a 8-vinyl-reductase
MPDGSGGGLSPGGLSQGGAGRIGPNAVWQLLPLVEQAGGAALRHRMLAEAGLWGVVPASGHVGLIDERPVARLHRAVRDSMGDLAPAILHQAGVRTADYILAHRIPPAAQWALRHLPDRLAARMLAKAIARNAWTFAGSGRFRVASSSPVAFALEANPLVAGEVRAAPACHWHTGVFERLFRALVSDRLRATEVACCACGAPECRFEVWRAQSD